MQSLTELRTYAQSLNVHVNVSYKTAWYYSFRNSKGIFLGLNGIPRKYYRFICAHELAHEILEHTTKGTRHKIIMEEIEAWKKCFELCNFDKNFDKDILLFAQECINSYVFRKYPLICF